MDTDPFVICTLGRSRTAWMARWLTYADRVCHFEALRFVRTLDDLGLYWHPGAGSAETAGAWAWDVLRHRVPRLRTVVVRRPVGDVIESFLALTTNGQRLYDEDGLRAAIPRLALALDHVARHHGVLTLECADLAREDACKALWARCLPYPWDARWWARWRDEWVECDQQEMIRYYHENRDGVEAFRRVVEAEMVR